MRPFLHWEYQQAKQIGNKKALERFRNAITEIAALTTSEYPVPIDEVRGWLGLPPHPDTIMGLGAASRGQQYLDAVNVDQPSDLVKPEGYDQALAAFIATLPPDLQAQFLE